MEDSIIEIKNDDFINNLDKIIENSNIFKENSNLEAINCYIFYLEDNTIFNYKKYEIQINENKLTKNELLSIVLNNNKFYSKKYDLTGIYKFEVKLPNNEIKQFCKDSKNYNFLTKYNEIQEIHFHPTIEILSENNCIILFFSNKSKETPPEENKEKNVKNILSKNKTRKQVKFNMKDNSNHGKKNKTIKK